MTVGKIFSSPSKPDQVGISSFICLEVTPYEGNPHGGGFSLKEGTKLELQRFSIFCQICLHPLQKLLLAMRNM